MNAPSTSEQTRSLEAAGPFPLLRHFSLAALLSVAAAAMLLSLMYRQSAFAELERTVEEQNLALAQALGNALLPEFGGFLLTAPDYTTQALRHRPEIQRIERAMDDLSAGLHLGEVSILGLDARVIYSSDKGAVGARRQPAAQGIAQSLVPLRSPQTGRNIAAFEFRRDLRPQLGRIAAAQLEVAAGIAAVLGLLFAALGLIVLRAERILRGQAARLRESGERYRLLFEANPLPMWLRNPASGRVLAVNDTALAHYGYSRERFLALGDDDLPLANLPRCTAFGSSDRVNHRRADGGKIPVEIATRLFQLGATPVQIVLAQDVSARLQAEAERDRLGHTLRMVGACNRLLVRARDAAQLRQGICEIIAAAGDYSLVWVALAGPDGSPDADAHAGREAARLWPLVERGMACAGALFLHCTAARHGEVSSGADVRVKGECAPLLKAIEEAGAPACVSLPLRCNDRLFGTLLLHADRPDAFAPPLLATLSELADDLAFGLAAHRDRNALAQSEERLRMALSCAGVASWQWDIEADRLNWGYDPAALLGPLAPGQSYPDFRQMVLAADRPAFIAAGTRCIQDASPYHCEFRIVRTDGRIVWIEAAGQPVRDAAGKPVGMMGVSRDVSVRRRSEADLRLRQRAMEASGEGIFILDVLAPGRPASWVNPAFEHITGHDRGEAAGRSARLLLGVHERQAGIADIFGALRRGEEGRGVLRCRRKDGSPYWCELSVAPVREDAGPVTHVVGVLSDITERVRHEEQLRRQATHDTLTGLANHGLFADRMQQALIHDRRIERTVAVLSLGVDRFKLVNDSVGHRAGDALLREIAERLAACVRAGDTVARLGGDEFAILLTDIARPEDVTALARKALAAVLGPLVSGERHLSLSASVGISLHPRDGADMETLLRHAEAAMRRAKAQGGNAFAYYTERMNERAHERLELEAQLRHALEHGELVLHYQPQLCLNSGAIRGVEALVRWQHPQRGLLGPGEFIPIAEETDLIGRIGDWVLASAAAQAVAWRQAGLPSLRVAVNVSARQLADPELVQRVRDVLAATGCEPSLLELELTETAVMHNPDEARQRLRAIRALGVSLAMDDFGTGYSSLSHLRRFPFDVLKVDRSFVSGIVSDPDDALVVRSILSMGRALGLRVVAEGVETEAQAALLADAGCGAIQGYWLSRPVAADALAALLGETGPARALPGNRRARGRTLLLVDDEPHVLSSLRRVLRNEGYAILAAGGAAEAMELLATHRVGVVVSDQRMPEISGTQFLRRVKQMYPDALRLMLSGYTDLKSVTDAINEGAIYKFVTKPWEDDQLRELVREAFERHELACENRRLREQLADAHGDLQRAAGKAAAAAVQPWTRPP